MFIELHIIQSFPPTNLNRDDMNQPKDCEFGGVRRARISSQCLKRAIRTSTPFKETIQVTPGMRTRRFMRLFKPRLIAAGKPEEETETVIKASTTIYAGLDSKNDEFSSVLVFLSDKEIQKMEKAMLENWDTILEAVQKKKGKFPKDALKKALKKQVLGEIIKQTQGRTSAPDIALFGRMLADNPELGMDAACQVAHAISTHAVKMDTDFFTAVEELAKPDETGAAMMDIAGFNCACFYRYARLDWQQLTKNLAGDTDLARRTAEAFLRASEAAMPTGKKSSHDNYTRPVFMLAVVRKEHSAGWSLVNAFEKPVWPWGGSGLVEPSVLALDRYWNDLCQFYGTQTVKAIAVALQPTLKPKELSETLSSAIKPSLDAWVQTMLDELQG